MVIYIPVTCTLGYDVGIFGGHKARYAEARGVQYIRAKELPGSPLGSLRSERNAGSFGATHALSSHALRAGWSKDWAVFLHFWTPSLFSPPLGSHHALWFLGISWIGPLFGHEVLDVTCLTMVAYSLQRNIACGGGSIKVFCRVKHPRTAGSFHFWRFLN